MNKTKQRIPRPKGSTELGHLYNKDKNNQESLNTFLNHIIKHYINTGFTYCGLAVNIEEFSNITNIPNEMVMENILEQGKQAYLNIDQDKQNEHLGALIQLSLRGSLSDRSNAQRQLNILLAAQGHSYKPFISGEVNKALKLNMEATTNILNIAKSLQGPGSVVINNNNAPQQHNYLTTEQALEILNKGPQGASLLADPNKKEVLYDEHNIGAMPEVKANRQHGLDVSREGLNFNKLVDLSDDKVDHLSEPNHIDRRALEEGLDLSQDDI